VIVESVSFKLIVIKNYSFFKLSGFLQYSRRFCFVVFVFSLLMWFNITFFLVVHSQFFFYFKSFSEYMVSDVECLICSNLCYIFFLQ